MPNDPCAILPPVAQALYEVKGETVTICRNRQLNGLLDVAVDCRDFNALAVQVEVNGLNPSAVISVEGCSEAGADSQALPDALNAVQTITANAIFEVTVGTRFAKFRIASIGGTFNGQQGYTIKATPYVSPGSPRVAASIVVDTLAAIQVLTGALTLSGVCDIGDDGGIYQGTGTFASPTTGLKIWNASGVGKIAGYNGGVAQWYADTDGKLYAGAGAVVMDANGITLAPFGGTIGSTLHLGVTGGLDSRFGDIYFISNGASSLQRTRTTHMNAAIAGETNGFWALDQYAGGNLALKLWGAPTGNIGLDVLNVYDSGVAIGEVPASAGILRLPSAQWIAARNANNDGDVNIIRVNSADQIELGNGQSTFVPLATPLTSASWDGDSYSTAAATLLDLSAVFGVPAGAKAVLISVEARDSASAANSTGVTLGPSASVICSWLSLTGVPNDSTRLVNNVVPCDANGDIYYSLTASGAGTLDVWLKVWGYWI